MTEPILLEGPLSEDELTLVNHLLDCASIALKDASRRPQSEDFFRAWYEFQRMYAELLGIKWLAV